MVQRTRQTLEYQLGNEGNFFSQSAGTGQAQVTEVARLSPRSSLVQAQRLRYLLPNRMRSRCQVVGSVAGRQWRTCSKRPRCGSLCGQYAGRPSLKRLGWRVHPTRWPQALPARCGEERALAGTGGRSSSAACVVQQKPRFGAFRPRTTQQRLASTSSRSAFFRRALPFFIIRAHLGLFCR